MKYNIGVRYHSIAIYHHDAIDTILIFTLPHTIVLIFGPLLSVLSKMKMIKYKCNQNDILPMIFSDRKVYHPDGILRPPESFLFLLLENCVRLAKFHSSKSVN